ncbi:MAG: carboxypeptidase-like regulatory domain-containing protein [Bacteroidales bacterium]|jgi:hypothetical protein|nr:carboxypeptidase-like regulatory domain-containing protein [Bacteroidales bacterium]
MKKFSILLAIVAIAFWGCRKENSNNEVKPTGNMQTVVLDGVISDPNGNPLSGVQVTTGNKSAITNAQGEFSLTQVEVINNIAVVQFEKSGYFSTTRSQKKSDDIYMMAVMYPKGNNDITLQTSFDSGTEKTLKIAGAEIQLPPSAFMRSDGSAYSGTINANILFIDPANKNYGLALPGGDYIAINKSGREVMHMPYSMINAEFTDNAGKTLQLKNGAQATVIFPIHNALKDKAPDAIPLWSFSVEKGAFIEDGIAMRNGDTYTATVTYFTPLSISDDDEFAPLVIPFTCTGKVVDCEGKGVRRVKVTVYSYASDGSYSDKRVSITNSDGRWSRDMCKAVGIVKEVSAIVIGKNNPEIIHDPDWQSDFVEISYDSEAGGRIEVADIELPCLDYEEIPMDFSCKFTGDKYGNHIQYLTYKDFGMQYREDSGLEEKKQRTLIRDFYAKKSYYGSGEDEDPWGPGNNDLDRPFEPMNDDIRNIFVGEREEFFVRAHYLKLLPDKEEIGGRMCKVYTGTISGVKCAAYWKGWQMKLEWNDGGVEYEVLSATTDVPNSAFTKTFSISWLP